MKAKQTKRFEYDGRLVRKDGNVFVDVMTEERVRIKPETKVTLTERCEK